MPVCNTLPVHLTVGLPQVDELIGLEPRVALSLVLSLDGQLCGPDGSSRSISGPEDLDWLRRLRAASDVILVGAATATAEGYRPIRVREEYAEMRAQAGMTPHPELVRIRRSDDITTVLRQQGPRVLLEAGIRLHTALAPVIDRIWLSHSPTVVGDHNAAFALPMDDFALADRRLGAHFVVSRFERISRR